MSGFTNLQMALGGAAPVPYILAVASGLNVLKTTDLTTWNTFPAAANETWVDVAIGPDGQAVAICNTGASPRAMRSVDAGESWVRATTVPGGAIVWASVAYSPTLDMYCAVGSNSGGAANIITSTDGGDTWTLTNTGARDIIYSSVIWAGDLGLFVGAGNAGLFDHEGIITSPDGLNWTVRTCNDGGWGHPTELQIINGVIYGTGQSSNTICDSADAITWASHGNIQAGGIVSMSGLPNGSRFCYNPQAANAVKISALPFSGYSLNDLGVVYRRMIYSTLFSEIVGVKSAAILRSTDAIVFSTAAVAAGSWVSLDEGTV